MLHVDTTTMQSMVLLTLTMEIADRKQDPTQAVCPNEDERNAKFAVVDDILLKAHARGQRCLRAHDAKGVTEHLHAGIRRGA